MHSQDQLSPCPLPKGEGTEEKAISTIVAADDAHAPDSVPVPLRGRVLLAEGDSDARELLRRDLQSVGLEVDAVDNGLEAVQRTFDATRAGQPYDLIVLDLQIPKLDGFEVIRLLRSFRWQGPVIALTAQAILEQQERCRAAGFHALVPKPVVWETLLATIRQGLVRCPAQPRHTVLLAEDDQLVRAGLRELVDGFAGFQVVAEASNGEEAIQQAEQFHPDIVLLDLVMPDMDGLNAAARLAHVQPKVKVVILSAHVRRETVAQALQAGAHGYVSKNTSPAELERALSEVSRGQMYVCAAAQHVFTDAAGVPDNRDNDLPGLTSRQREVLQRIAEGDSTRMIADKLGVSSWTVAHHRADIMRLLDIHDTAGLVRHAVRIGLVERNS